MKPTLNNWTKFFLFALFLGISIYGFMLKLPSVFRGHDKELHSLFYFIAAAFLNILFTNKKITTHILIFGFLYLMGVSIEYAQEYSNKYFHARLHGRYDKEVVQANIKGLIAFSCIWVVYLVVSLVVKKEQNGNE